MPETWPGPDEDVLEWLAQRPWLLEQKQAPLPPGIALGPDGVISGIPTTFGLTSGPLFLDALKDFALWEADLDG